MNDAVIVSTVRTPIGKAYRGAFNNLESPTMAAHVLKHAVERAKVEPAEVDDVVMGAAMQEGTQGFNLARQALIAAGWPVTVPGMTIDRQCSSSLMSIATACKAVVVDRMPIVVAGGIESISLVQNKHANRYRMPDPNTIKNAPAVYMPMIDTAEVVAKRYRIGREAQDEYSLQSQQRIAKAQEAGLFADEIVPLTATKAVTNKETKEVSYEEVTLEKDEGNRPDTTLEGLASLKPVRGEGFCITAGNASQLSDGASACVVMDSKVAEKRGLEPLGIYRGMAVAGTEPDEMGIGPVFAVPKLLERTGVKLEDIGVWELNEAFAVQTLYCRDKLGIDNSIFNINGGAIAIGHPYGMTGARCVGHALLEGKRQKAKYACVTMCIGGGMGAAGLFEIC
jgi:acetyl-CoA acetyltransferase family protein